MGAVALALLGGYAGAFFGKNPGLVPGLPTPHQPADLARKAKIVASTAKIIVGGAPVYSVGDPHGRPVQLLGLNAPVSVLGYCIAPPEPEGRGAVLDERWLLLPHGRMIAAWRVGEALAAGRQPTPCPGAGALGGPTKIALREPELHGSRLLLRAAALGASTIGFAVFDHRWHTVAVERASRDGLARASVPRHRPLVILAVACWADELPAHPGGQILVGFQTFGDPSSRTTGPAVEEQAVGAKRACASATYGAPTPPHGHPRRATYFSTAAPKDSLPPATTVPAHLTHALNPSYQPATGGGESASPPSPGTSSTSTSKTGSRKREPRETVGPEQTQNFDHHHEP